MLLEKIKNTIKKYRLIDKNDKIIVGVSGGPDSLALLYLLNNLKKELKISLHIAHLDHCLRKESHRDRKFVENLAGQLNLPVTVSCIDVKKIAKQGGSQEEIARNVRLNFLFKIAQKIKATKIALGHNLDDQAETVLMRILRGTGLFGLGAILPKRKISGFTVIRPLIEIKRRDIEVFLKKKGIKPRIDFSNQKDIYFRNKIRNRLLPLLEKEYNRNIKEMLSNLAESASLDYDYLNQITQKIVRKIQKRIVLDKFFKLHPALQRLLLRYWIAKLKGNTRRITFQHIREIEDLIFFRPINSIVDLPEGVSVVKKKKSLVFIRK
jgi:tRNA(Ile)-lysidine synthase